MKRPLFILFVFIPPALIFSQYFPTNPDSSELITTDIENFWQAFDLMEKGYDGNPFDENYMKIGSQGVMDFTPYRIESGDMLLKNVRENKEQYLAVKENTFRINEKKKQILATFYALKYLLPEAKFPPVYFVIGNFNSGGTSSDNGLIIGAETQSNIDNVPYLVAHELIHFQQKKNNHNRTLLEQSINEGVADFLGEMISGNHFNKTAYEYGELHKQALCEEFVEILDSDNWNDWLYGTSGKDNRPNDLGYWMGYQIAKSYFDQQGDKSMAIKELLDIKNAKLFLEKSGFLNKYRK